MSERPYYTSPEVCRMAGITFRQLDYWATTSLLVPSYRDAHGSGTARLYTDADVNRARSIATMLAAGLSLPAVRTALESPEKLREFVDRLSDVAATVRSEESYLVVTA